MIEHQAQENMDHMRERIEKAKQGDSEAFAYLYNTYLTPLYRFIYFRVKNTQDAEDLTQTVFIKAWEAIGSYEDKGYSFSSWLYTIARNTVTDYWKKKKPILVADPKETFGHIADTKENSHEKMANRELQEEIIHHIQTLSEEQQTILILKFMSERTNEEIEEITGKRQDAIRALQYRALKTLKKRMKGLPTV